VDLSVIHLEHFLVRDLQAHDEDRGRAALFDDDVRADHAGALIDDVLTIRA
jgi:hypothetical protein